MLALPWSFAPESWTGWDPKGTRKPRGQQVKGKRAQPPLLGAQPGLDPKQEAGARHFPALGEMAAALTVPEVHSLSWCFQASPRLFGELLLKSSFRSHRLCVFCMASCSASSGMRLILFHVVTSLLSFARTVPVNFDVVSSVRGKDPSCCCY